MFADDMKLFLVVRWEDDSLRAADLSSCQRDIDELHRAAVSWDLRFNVGKCVTMRFCRGRDD